MAVKHHANCVLVGNAVGYSLNETLDSANMVSFADKLSDHAHTRC